MTKLKTINEYQNQIEYKKLTLTRDIDINLTREFFLIKKLN